MSPTNTSLPKFINPDLSNVYLSLNPCTTASLASPNLDKNVGSVFTGPAINLPPKSG